MAVASGRLLLCSLLLLLCAREAQPLRVIALSPTRAPLASRSHAAVANVRVAGDVVMQQEGGGGEGAREGEKQRGRTAVIAKPKPKAKSKRKEEVENEPSWRVLLHNDDVHTFDYVSMAIVRVVKTITRKKAHRICCQAHSMGTACVTTTWKQMAKTYCLKLQKYGLTSSIAPDASHTS